MGDRTDRETTARRALEERMAHLAKPNLKSIDEEFSARRGKAKFDPPWFSLDGIQSVRSLAKHLNRLAEYETFYSRGSQIMHAGTYRDHLNVLSGGEVAFIPIRHVSDMSALLRSVFTVTLASYSKVVETYLSEEAEVVRELYVRKWREPFIDMPNINVEYR
nr:H420 [uncultured bacterium]